MGCLIRMNLKQLHLVAEEDNEPKNARVSMRKKTKKKNGEEQQQVQAVTGRGDEEKRNGE